MISRYKYLDIRNLLPNIVNDQERRLEIRKTGRWSSLEPIDIGGAADICHLLVANPPVLRPAEPLGHEQDAPHPRTNVTCRLPEVDGGQDRGADRITESHGVLGQRNERPQEDSKGVLQVRPLWQRQQGTPSPRRITMETSIKSKLATLICNRFDYIREKSLETTTYVV